MRPLVQATAVLAAFAVAGCLFPSLDSLSAATDAAADAYVADAAVDGPRGSYCTTLDPKPSFCADFDDGDLPSGFDALVQWGSAVGLLDNGPLGDPARSFHASTATLSGSDQGASYFKKTFPTTASSIRFEFDYLPIALEGTERAVAAVVFYAGSAYDQVNLLVSDSGARVAEGATLSDGGAEYAGGPLAHGFVVGQWTHVRWVLTIGSGSSSSSMTLDSDAVEYDALVAHEFIAPPELDVGLLYVTAPSPGWAARIDNVVIDVH